MSLFVEIFPVNLDSFPDLIIYKLGTIGSRSLNEVGRKLRYRLQNQYKGHWYWDEEIGCLITDTPLIENNIQKILEELWNEEDKFFAESLETLTIVSEIQPSLKGKANFAAHALLGDIDNEIKRELKKFSENKDDYSIDLECRRFGWVVNDAPAVSISIRSNLNYKGDLQKFIAKFPNDSLIGLHVTDKTKPFDSSMEITEVIGKIEEKRRERLLSYKLSPEMRKIIEKAAPNELVLMTNNKYQYVESALGIRIYNEDYARFDISERLQIPSNKRAQYVLPIAKISQTTGFIKNAYNSQTYPHLFLKLEDIGYDATLKFANDTKVIKEYGDVFNSVKMLGIYRPTNNKQIRIGILNTAQNINLKIFKDQIRQKLSSDLGFDLKLAGEETIDKPSRATLEQSINKLAQGRKPDIILAILPQQYGNGDDDEWTLYDHFKSLALAQDIQSQVIQPKNINNKWVIGNVALGILAKTGNIPYILANPIQYADFIVGIDVSRRIKSNRPGTMNTAAMAKIYLANGELLRYSIREATVEGEKIPKHILQGIFPVDEFGGKRIVIHRDGRFPDGEIPDLLEWGNQINSQFYFVEIIKSGNPRMYKQEGPNTLRAPKGSIFKFSESEAFLVSSTFPDSFEATPQPIRVRTHQSFPLEQALHSALTLTLLHYGSERPPRLPVTTFYADKISKMTSKGLKPKSNDGCIPFWI